MWFLGFYLIEYRSFRTSGHSGSPQTRTQLVFSINNGAIAIKKVQIKLREGLIILFIFFKNMHSFFY